MMITNEKPLSADARCATIQLGSQAPRSLDIFISVWILFSAESLARHKVNEPIDHSTGSGTPKHSARSTAEKQLLSFK